MLSQDIELSYATDLSAGAMAPGADVPGFVLKDRIARLEVIMDALERIHSGGVALDPEIDSTAFSKPRTDPLAALMRREL